MSFIIGPFCSRERICPRRFLAASAHMMRPIRVTLKDQLAIFTGQAWLARELGRSEAHAS